ncbi:MAG: hypothetical protein ABI596_17895 [Pyrinomonadaceae bacterium]
MHKKSYDLAISTKTFATILIAILTLAVLFDSRPQHAAIHLSPTPQRKPAIVVFAVSGDAGEFNMDAVVMVDGKRLRAPFTDEQKGGQKKFADTYFATGKKYHLMFGGGAAGDVTLKKWTEGCNSIHADVAVSTSARLGGQVKALATNSQSLGQPASARRAPTDAERTGVMALVKSIYAQHGVNAALFRSLIVTNLTATDVDGDGRYEMIGSFTLAASNKFERDLFLIAKPQGTLMRGDFVKFQAYQPPAEGFLSSIDFIDQLDLDGDGVGEVFAMQGGFDAYGFSIFKKQAGRWRMVYTGIGDAC